MTQAYDVMPSLPPPLPPSGESGTRFLYGLGRTLRKLNDPRQILATAAQQLGRYLEVNRIGYAHVQADNETIEIETDFVDGVAALGGRHPLLAFGRVNAATLRRGETSVFADVQDDPAMADAVFAAIETRALVAVPFMRDGRLTAGLFVNGKRPRLWSRDDVNLIEEVAARVWETVERAHAEAALRAVAVQLEQRVAERSAELATMGESLQTVRGERDLASTTVRETEQAFRLLVEGVTDYAIYMVDPNGIITNWNRGAERIKGYRAYEIVGQHFSRFYTEEERAEKRPARALQTADLEGRFETEGWRLRKDGTRFWASIVIDPLRADNGKLIGFAKITRDITERLETQKALEQAREQLFQAQKMEAVGQLTGGIAHDFNNLLTGIIGSIELMQRRVRQGRYDDLERYGQAASAAATRAAALTHRLLAFSRRQPLHPKHVDANHLVRSTEDLLQRTIGESVRIAFRLEPALWGALCDPNQLESAILNLAINSRDAMPGGGTLTIETRNVVVGREHGDDVTPGEFVRVAAVDTGSGMPPEIVARAFDPFFTTKPVGQGTGLGLSMIYGFARQSGGFTTITSAVGVGTTVAVHLPRSEQPAGEEAPAIVAVGNIRARPGETVVVVEDEAEVRDLVLELLRDLGYATLAAADATGGLAHLDSAARVDLLVTDVGLPGLNGYGLADQARGKRPGLPVLFMTGYADAAAPGPPLAASMALIAKPFDLDAFAKHVRDMISGAAPRP